MAVEPGTHLGVLVNSVVVEDDMDGFAGRHLGVDGVEEADERQAGLGTVERLDLALLVDGQHDGVGRRIDVEADDVAQFGDELRAGSIVATRLPMRRQASSTVRFWAQRIQCQILAKACSIGLSSRE